MKKWFAVIMILAVAMVAVCFAEDVPAAVPDGFQAEAEKISAERFSAGFGLYDYYDELLEQFGDFRFWTPRQKYDYCGILNELLKSERERIARYCPGEVYSELLESTILQWNYGAPDAAALSEGQALDLAEAWLRERNMDVTGCTVSAALYTGHWSKGDFTDPWWAFRFYIGETLTGEVWVNSNTGSIPKHQPPEVIIAVWDYQREAFPEGFTIAGETVTEDMADRELVMTVPSEEEHEWLVVIPYFHSFGEITVDDDTLEVLDVDASNG